MAKRAPGAVCMRHEATRGAPPRLCGHRSTVAGHLVVGRRSSVPCPLPPAPCPLLPAHCPLLAASPRSPYICHDPWPSPPMSEPSPRNRRTANPDGMEVVVRDHLPPRRHPPPPPPPPLPPPPPPPRTAWWSWCATTSAPS